MSEEIKKINHPIEEILGDFIFYKEPELLKPGTYEPLDVKSANMDAVEKYLGLLSNVRYAWQKILKYEKYFAKFYTSDGSVEDFEALNHHIHAYLQDMDTLKNKIEIFLNSLKKDLKKIAVNKKEVVAFIDAGVKKNHEVFEGVLKYRRPHVHNGTRFMDGDLLKAENAYGALGIFSNPIFDKMLKQEYKPQLIARFEKEKEESFKEAKARWIKMAHNNNEQTSGYLGALLKGVRSNLYQFLKIKPVKEIVEGTKG